MAFTGAVKERQELADPYPAIPQELKNIHRWFPWKESTDPETGKTRKIPTNAAGLSGQSEFSQRR